MTKRATDDPLETFAQWLNEAKEKELNDPTAMALATDSGMPSVRMVLLKDVSAAGFTFYTNCESKKGRQLTANPKAALCFHWKSLRRQIRVEGDVDAVDAEDADAYFASRARDSQIGAWASQQSRPLEGRLELERRIARYAAKFALGTVPRPPHWSGFKIMPTVIEFWRERPFRLHDRQVYRRQPDGWQVERQYP